MGISANKIYASVLREIKVEEDRKVKLKLKPGRLNEVKTK